MIYGLNIIFAALLALFSIPAADAFALSGPSKGGAVAAANPEAGDVYCFKCDQLPWQGGGLIDDAIHDISAMEPQKLYGTFFSAGTIWLGNAECISPAAKFVFHAPVNLITGLPPGDTAHIEYVVKWANELPSPINAWYFKSYLQKTVANVYTTRMITGSEMIRLGVAPSC